MIKVGIDITATIYQRGVSRYTRNLVRTLLTQKELELSLYGSSLRQRTQLQEIAEELKAQVGAKAPTVIQPYPPSLYNFLWNKVGYPRLRSVLPDIELFHSWDWLQPPDSDLPLISTIHDLAVLKFPETAHPKILAMHQQSWKRLKERNATIIAVSRATKRDVVQLLDFPESRVHVVHEALPEEVIAVSRAITEEIQQGVIAKLELTRPFILFVGTREPRKNIQRLIEAWRPLHKDIDLIVAGEEGWDEVKAKDFEDVGEHLRFLGKVSDQELAILYSEAKLFAFPSLYEGFGLPILEAFYHGTPVVTSDISSMPEVAGNAAELVDPEDVESIRDGIQFVLDEDQTQQQLRLQRMIIRQQMFSWQTVGTETMRVYKQAIARAQAAQTK